MKNLVRDDSDIVSVAAPSGGVTSGEGVLVGGIFGFAMTTADEGEMVALKRRGVYTHAKTSAQEWAVGDAIYWDSGNSVLTTTITSVRVGLAYEAAANPSSTGTVLLDPSIAGQAANQAAVSTVDGSDAGTTQTLANDLKAAHNALLVKLKASGLMAADA